MRDSNVPSPRVASVRATQEHAISNWAKENGRGTGCRLRGEVSSEEPCRELASGERNNEGRGNNYLIPDLDSLGWGEDE